MLKTERNLTINDSSHIQAICYNTDSKQMTVLFKDQSLYCYESVPIATFGLLSGAESVGGVFNVIKNKLKGYKL